MFSVRISVSKLTSNAEHFILHYMQNGVIKILIDFLEEVYECYPELQVDASWALCNITAALPQSVAYAVKNGIIENTLKALDYGQGTFLEHVCTPIHLLTSSY